MRVRRDVKLCRARNGTTFRTAAATMGRAEPSRAGPTVPLTVTTYDDAPRGSGATRARDGARRSASASSRACEVTDYCCLHRSPITTHYARGCSNGGTRRPRLHFVSSSCQCSHFLHPGRKWMDDETLEGKGGKAKRVTGSIDNERI